MQEFQFKNAKYHISKVDTYVPIVITVDGESSEKVDAKINFMTGECIVTHPDYDWAEAIAENVFKFINNRDTVDSDMYAQSDDHPDYKSDVIKSVKRREHDGSNETFSVSE